MPKGQTKKSGRPKHKGFSCKMPQDQEERLKTMKKALILLIIMSVSMSLLFASYTRPPEPPVPFPYDPNRVDCEILKIFERPPDNGVLFMYIKAYEQDGEDVNLLCSSSQVWVPPKTDVNYSKIVDPNGVAIHKWRCDMRIGTAERVIYLKFTATDVTPDPNEALSDSRMILINVEKKNLPPIIDWY